VNPGSKVTPLLTGIHICPILHEIEPAGLRVSGTALLVRCITPPKLVPQKLDLRSSSFVMVKQRQPTIFHPRPNPAPAAEFGSSKNCDDAIPTSSLDFSFGYVLVH
jgi:hypothetical protein